MKMELPNHVTTIINTLNEAGYEAYAVGGCVRDNLLGVTPKDWDITTSALPQEIKALFPRTIDTGIEHGTVTVMMEKIGYEVTTYRVDGEYEDGRHPKQVQFTASILEDLKRRDFTINAMAYHPEKDLIDAFDGVGDLKRKEIRCVGEATLRFTEDALRMLRAVRFSGQLGCVIEPETLKAMGVLAPNLAKVSVERIYMELTKLLISPYPEKLQYAFDTGLAPYIMPEMEQLAKDSHRVEEMLENIKNSQRDLWVRLAILLSYMVDENDEMQMRKHCQKMLRHLKTDLQTINEVSKLVAARLVEIEPTAVGVRRFFGTYGSEFWHRYIEVTGILAGKNLDERKKIGDDIIERGECVSIKQLALNGTDVKSLGVEQGKGIGEMLSYLLGEVIEHPEWNTRERLKELVLNKQSLKSE